MDNPNLKPMLQARFGRDAHAYLVSAGHAAGADLLRLVELAETGPETVVLDVATGAGHTALALAARAAHVVATDLTPRMLAVAREWCRSRGAAGIAFACADAETLPFPDGAFARVACRFAAHHFADVERAVVEMARVLGPGGRLLVVDNYAPEDAELDAFVNRIEWLRDALHVRSYRCSEWRRLLERAELAIDREESFERRHDFAEWTARGSTPPDRLISLIETIRQAPERVRAHFQVVLGEDGVEAWMAPQVLFRAHKPVQG